MRKFNNLLVVGWITCGCGASPATPAQAAGDRYDGMCSLLQLEVAERPLSGTSSQVERTDTVELFATYAFDASSQSRRTSGPLHLRFRAARERREEMEAQLRTHPRVVCGSEGLGHEQEFHIEFLETQETLPATLLPAGTPLPR